MHKTRVLFLTRRNETLRRAGGGMEAVNKLRGQDPGGEKAHKELLNPKSEHQGVKKYNQTKDELIEQNSDYKNIFEEQMKLYEEIYK